jgi:hypothetical protein
MDGEPEQFDIVTKLQLKKETAILILEKGRFEG